MRKLSGPILVFVAVIALAVIPTALAKAPSPQSQVVVRIALADYVTDGGVAKITGTINNRSKSTLRYVAMYFTQAVDNGTLDITKAAAELAAATKADGLRLSDQHGISLAIGPLKPGIRPFTVWVRVIDRDSEGRYLGANFYCVRAELDRINPGGPNSWYKSSNPTCGQYVANTKK